MHCLIEGNGVDLLSRAQTSKLGLVFIIFGAYLSKGSVLSESDTYWLARLRVSAQVARLSNFFAGEVFFFIHTFFKRYPKVIKHSQVIIFIACDLVKIIFKVCGKTKINVLAEMLN